MTDNASAGATPAAAGTTPVQTPVIPAAAPVNGAATDADAPLGEPGLKALQAERTARETAERTARDAQKALDELKAQHATAEEKAYAKAKAEGAAEVLDRANDRVRISEVKSALVGAGLNAGLVPLAAKADEFQALKVNDEGEVVGLAEAVKAFKEKQPALFATAAPAPRDFGGGPRGTPAAGGNDMNKLIRQAAGRR
jgi:hypothetical protein